MGLLEDLQASIENKKAELRQRREQKAEYLRIAGEIDELYQQLKEDKDGMKEYRESVKTFKSETFDNFKGNLYQTTYKPKITDLISSYKTVISNIDTNLDALNNAKKDYENKAYNCDILIGGLESGINSAVHTVQNWFN